MSIKGSTRSDNRVVAHLLVGVSLVTGALVVMPLGLLGAADGDLPPEAEVTLPSSAELDLGEFRDRARPVSAIVDDDLSLAVSRVASGQEAGQHVLTEADTILVDVHHDLPGARVEALISSLGGRLYRHISDALTEAFFPAVATGLLQQAAGVVSVHLPPSPLDLASTGPPVPLVGSVASESVAKANIPAWHSAGFTGNGMKIGIIDSFDASVFGQAQASGDVPTAASEVCLLGGVACSLWSVTPGAQHGTAVTEIVHDVAPTAALHLGNGLTPGDYVGVIDHFAAMGVTVINHSRTWQFDGPGDGTGPAAAVIDYAASKGILWVNAAGNLADGGYWRGSWNDPDANGWHNFGVADEIMGFVCHPGLGLRWDDWSLGGRTDYDVYIWDDIADVGNLLALKAFSVADQTMGADPLEYYGDSLLAAGCSDPLDVDYLAINLFAPGDDAAGDTLELGVFQLGEYWVSDHSAAIPFGDTFNPAALSVGAVDPPLGTTIGPYSSQGPTNDDRMKPDLSAASGVTSFTYGIFQGTSASAPVIAGAAALLIQSENGSSATEAAGYLRGGSATVDRGAPGPDNVYGAGELLLPTPPTSPPPPPSPTPPPSPPTDLVGLVDPASGRWYLRGQTGLISSFFYGNPADTPFMGDWNCDGVETPGLFRVSDAFAYLRNSNTQGIADIRFFFGNPADVPLAGDFDGDGCDTLSIYRPSEQRFYIINALGANNGGLGAAEFSFLFGNPGDKPFVGDFDGDGIDEVGLHRESTGFVYYRNTLTTGIADNQFFFGDPGDRFVAGDWGIIDGVDTPGLFRPSNTTFYFRHTNTQGNADSQFVWGQPGWLPVSGRFGLD